MTLRRRSVSSRAGGAERVGQVLMTLVVTVWALPR
jgi:hypothetical protein